MCMGFRKTTSSSIPLHVMGFALLCSLYLAACSPASDVDQGGQQLSGEALTPASSLAPVQLSASSAASLLPKPQAESFSSSPEVSDADLAVDIKSLPAECEVDGNLIAQQGLDAFFWSQEIPDDVFARMEGVTFLQDCPVPRGDLRYLRLLHVDAQGNSMLGEMVAHESIAQDLCEIFRELYDAGVAIERMRLADDYAGDDEASMRDNNTSAFNCRPIEGTGAQSLHSYGMAVDVNPLYNPYVRFSNGIVLPATAGDYVDRNRTTAYTIEPGDACCQAFENHGFVWGGYWDGVKDYQHFEMPW